MLAFSTHVAPFDKTMRVFHLLHPFVEVDFPPFVDDFHHETEVTLDRKSFISTLACSPYLYSSGPLNMMYEHLQNCFVPNDFASGFDLFFQGMWAHCSRSCLIFSVIFYVLTPCVGKIVWRHTSFCDQ